VLSKAEELVSAAFKEAMVTAGLLKGKRVEVEGYAYSYLRRLEESHK
jgi:hypothetical protein